MLLLELLPLGCRLYHAPNLLRADDQPADEVQVHGVAYRRDAESTEAQGFLGFFDWLRADLATVVGVRLCPFPYLPYQALLRRYPYAMVCYENQCTEIQFVSGHYDPTLSGDQDFSFTYVYRSADQLLLTFPIDHFTEPEWARLLTLCQPLQE
jgi:hypothetical protein